MSRALLCLGCVLLTLSFVTFWGADGAASDSAVAPGRKILRATDSSDGSKCRYIIQVVKKKTKKAAKKEMPEDSTEKPATAAAGQVAATPDDGKVKFSRDIAPIFVNNCARCHNTAQRKGKFDLSTFEKLMAGSDAQKVIVPGAPADSELILKIRGESASGKKMPPGNRENLADSAIARIEEWVKAGALLDSGIDPKEKMEKYAPSPAQLRRAAIAKLTPEERDKQLEAIGLERWKKGSVKETPEILSGKYVMLFSTLPKDRAAAALKQADLIYPKVRGLIPPSAPDVEKVSLFVYKDKPSFAEFVRSVESREVEPTDAGSANLGVDHPFVVVVDPLAGQEEPAGASTPKKTTSRSKKAAAAEEETSGVERSLGSLLAENLAIGAMKAEGKAPQWLSLGVGAYFAAAVDPNSTYIRGLKRDALVQAEQGWTSRASDALGGESKVEEIRAVGFGIVEWMATEAKNYFPAFLRGMAEGGDKLDDVVGKVFNGSRQDFLGYSGQFVTARFGRGR